MNKKDLYKDIGNKLNKFRRSLNYSTADMCSRLKVVRSSYLRNESGKTSPGIWTMRSLGRIFDISLDWLILDKGPMIYREKEEKKEEKQEQKQEEKQPEQAAPLQEPPVIVLEEKPAPETVDSLPEDIRELLAHIRRIPLLRHEIMVSFYKFKEEHKEMVTTSM